MSALKDAAIYIGQPLPPYASVDTTNSIHLYCVRMYDSKKDLKLQLDFGRHITFTFNENKQLSDHHHYGPIVYTLDLQLIVERLHQHLYVDHANHFKYIEDFDLKCSQNGLLGKSFAHEGRTDSRHSLRDYLDVQHLFLFTVHFHPSHGVHLPGNALILLLSFLTTTLFLCVGEETSLYTDLCLLTCFLLHTHKHYLFDLLANQFRSTLAKEDHHTFGEHDFDEFFQMCLKYLPYPSKNDRNEVQTLSIRLKMMGLLSPMKKETFHRNCAAAQQFTSKMMSEMRRHLNTLMEVINRSEWDMMKLGFGLLCCFDLLFEKMDDVEANTLDLLVQISEKELREDLTYVILQQLSQLDKPIATSINWTNLFTLINPQKININHLNAACSFETFVLCIMKISKVMSMPNNFEEQIADYLENRVFFHHLKSKLSSVRSIFTLFTFS